MDSRDVVYRLQKFADGSRFVTDHGGVAISGGYAYATDGRVMIREPVQGVHDDKGNFPVDASEKTILNVAEGCRWYEMDKSAIADALLEYDKTREAAGADSLLSSGRFIEVQCPTCGSFLYFDKDREVLVSYGDVVAMCDAAPYPVRLVVGDRSLLVNLRLLRNVIEAYGLVQVSVCEDRKDMILVRSPDVGMLGAVMGMRSDGKPGEIAVISTNVVADEKKDAEVAT